MASEVTGDSPHAIAYRLMEIIAINEGHPLIPGKYPERKWVLDTYKECINAVLDVKRYGPYGTG